MTCPTCGGVLADMRGRTMFEPVAARTVGVCALWSDGNYECAFKDSRYYSPPFSDDVVLVLAVAKAIELRAAKGPWLSTDLAEAAVEAVDKHLGR